MKNILITTLLLLGWVVAATAQQDQLNRKERRELKQEQKKEEIKSLLENRTFIFVPTHAMPLGGGNIYLNHSFDAEVNGDTLISYLPFYGVAYRAEYGARNSAFDFTQPIDEFELNENRNGYRINFDVKNKMDYLTFNFQVSELGFATLNITSTNRQAMSFYGRIEAPEEKEE